MIVTFAMFALAALATVGWIVPAGWWAGLVLGAAATSTLMLVLFFSPALLLGFAINAALWWLVLATVWNPMVARAAGAQADRRGTRTIRAVSRRVLARSRPRLTGMRERIAALGGSVQRDGSSGMRVRASLPPETTRGHPLRTAPVGTMGHGVHHAPCGPARRIRAFAASQ